MHDIAPVCLFTVQAALQAHASLQVVNKKQESKTLCAVLFKLYKQHALRRRVSTVFVAMRAVVLKSHSQWAFATSAPEKQKLANWAFYPIPPIIRTLNCFVHTHTHLYDTDVGCIVAM